MLLLPPLIGRKLSVLRNSKKVENLFYFSSLLSLLLTSLPVPGLDLGLTLAAGDPCSEKKVDIVDTITALHGFTQVLIVRLCLCPPDS